MGAFAAPLIGAGISALAGLFGGRPQTTRTTQDTSGTQTYGGRTAVQTAYQLNPFQRQLASMFTQGAMNQYNQATNLAPYTSQGMQQIAGQGRANTQMINNILAQRGLSFSPAAATGGIANALSTGAQQSQFLAGVPLLRQQLQASALGNLMNAFRAMPFDVSQTGTSSGMQTTNQHMTGTQTGGGNVLGGLFGGAGAGLFAPGGLLGSQGYFSGGGGPSWADLGYPGGVAAGTQPAFIPQYQGMYGG